MERCGECEEICQRWRGEKRQWFYLQPGIRDPNLDDFHRRTDTSHSRPPRKLGRNSLIPHREWKIVGVYPRRGALRLGYWIRIDNLNSTADYDRYNANLHPANFLDEVTRDTIIVFVPIFRYLSPRAVSKVRIPSGILPAISSIVVSNLFAFSL